MIENSPRAASANRLGKSSAAHAQAQVRGVLERFVHQELTENSLRRCPRRASVSAKQLQGQAPGAHFSRFVDTPSSPPIISTLFQSLQVYRPWNRCS